MIKRFELILVIILIITASFLYNKWYKEFPVRYTYSEEFKHLMAETNEYCEEISHYSDLNNGILRITFIAKNKAAKKGLLKILQNSDLDDQIKIEIKLKDHNP